MSTCYRYITPPFIFVLLAEAQHFFRVGWRCTAVCGETSPANFSDPCPSGRLVVSNARRLRYLFDAMQGH